MEHASSRNENESKAWKLGRDSMDQNAQRNEPRPVILHDGTAQQCRTYFAMSCFISGMVVTMSVILRDIISIVVCNTTDIAPHDVDNITRCQ